jgi:PIN domain nuclease of toxin-antitoxin system
MRILIDTHTFIWYTGKGNNLSLMAKELIASDDTDVILSIASLWEISIKVALDRLEIEVGFDNLPEILIKYNIEILPVVFAHTLMQSRMPFHHKDPFDRMIAAQAIVEDIPLVSVDDAFDPYFADTGVKRIW